MPKVWIAGTPVAQGSVRAIPTKVGGAVVLADNRASLLAWRHEIKQAMEDELAERGEGLTEEAVAIFARFLFLRPAGHWRKNGELRASARPTPSIRPDIDKLARAMLDALSGVLYRDDAQVVTLTVHKEYAAGAGLALWWDVIRR